MKTEEEQYIVKLAFIDELNDLVKTAGLPTFLVENLPKIFSRLGTIFGEEAKTGKFFTTLGQAYAHSPEFGSQYLRSFMHPRIVKTVENNVKKFTDITPWAEKPENINKIKSVLGQKGLDVYKESKDKFVPDMLARGSHKLNIFGKDLSMSNNPIKNMGYLVRNIGNEASDSYRRGIYKIMPKDKPLNEVGKIKNGLVNRKVIGYTREGRPIVKKLLPFRALHASITPLGIGVSTYASTGNKKEALKDYLSWQTPIGPIEATKSLFKLI
jgi:hypothetical protein